MAAPVPAAGFDNNAAAWTNRLTAAAQIGAAALVGFGIILYVAANWRTLGTIGQFSLLGAVLAASALLAALLPAARVPGSLIAFATTGGMLALLGITYQTGADPWQLFALWAALTLPLALAARHDVVWCGWTLVVSTALPLWLYAVTGQPWGGAQLGPTLLVWVVAAALAGLLSPWSGLETWIGRTRWAFRLATMLLIALVATRALMSLWEPRQQYLFFVGLAIIVAIVATLVWLKPLDFSLLAIAAIAADTLLISALWRMVFASNGRGDVFTFLMLGLMSTGIVVATVRALISVAHDSASGRGWKGKLLPVGDLPDGISRWPAVVLSAFGALMAASPFMMLYSLLFGRALEKGVGPLLIGAGTIVAGAFLARRSRPYGFGQMFGLIALVVGDGVLGIWLAKNFSVKGIAFSYLLLAVGLTMVIPARWIASLHGFTAALCAAVLIGPDYTALAKVVTPRWFDPLLVPVMLIAVVGAVAVLALTMRNSDRIAIPRLPEQAEAFALGWATAALLATMAVAGPTFLLGATWNTSAVSALPMGADLTTFSGPRVLAMIIAAGAIAGYAFWRGSAMTLTGWAVAAAVFAMSYLVPVFAIAVLMFGAMLVAGRRSGMALSAFTGLWCIGTFYYLLGMPLTQKAGVLIAMGAALGVAASWDRLRLRQLAPFASVAEIGLKPTLAAALIAVSAIATGVTVTQSIAANEQVIRDGQRIYVALAPVDPRSLMQGDFMALRFQMPAVPPNIAHQSQLQAVANVDARGVATVTRIAVPPVTLGPGESRIDLVRKGRWTIATDAFFFPEGTGKRYEGAKFGEFRLLANGRPVLIGLVDGNLAAMK